MPLYQRDGHWGENLYREFAALPLPGPAVVIDVRHKADDEGRLICYLAVELEDLTTEMRLNQVHYWRHLAECIDFLKVMAGQPDPTQDRSTAFVVTTRMGNVLKSDKDELAMYINRWHLDRVLNNRI